MRPTFRIIDTGIREGRSNIAFDAALIEARRDELVPDTIRFLRFPPTALIGRHQDLSRELNLDYCRSHGVGVVRRITGGGAIYLDEGQLGWELVFHRKALGIAALPDIAREICTAAAAGLAEFGIDARFRPRNDIEVDGRKISGTGGFYDGDILIYQGTVLVDLNPERMVQALNIPESKLQKRQLASGAERVVTLKELLGPDTPDLEMLQAAMIKGFRDVLGIDAMWGEITAAEERLAKTFFDEEIGTDEFLTEIDDPAADKHVLTGHHTGPGGSVDAFIRLEGADQSIVQRVLLSGDFFVTPPRVVLDLEAHLKGVRLDDVGDAIESFFRDATVDTLSVTPEDFHASIEDALSQRASHV